MNFNYTKTIIIQTKTLSPGSLTLVGIKPPFYSNFEYSTLKENSTLISEVLVDRNDTSPSTSYPIQVIFSNDHMHLSQITAYEQCWLKVANLAPIFSSDRYRLFHTEHKNDCVLAFEINQPIQHHLEKAIDSESLYIGSWFALAITCVQLFFPSIVQRLLGFKQSPKSKTSLTHSPTDDSTHIVGGGLKPLYWVENDYNEFFEGCAFSDDDFNEDEKRDSYFPGFIHHEGRNELFFVDAKDSDFDLCQNSSGESSASTVVITPPDNSSSLPDLPVTDSGWTSLFQTIYSSDVSQTLNESAVLKMFETVDRVGDYYTCLNDVLTGNLEALHSSYLDKANYFALDYSYGSLLDNLAKLGIEIKEKKEIDVMNKLGCLHELRLLQIDGSHWKDDINDEYG